jgi:hypothetical protein
VFGFLGASQPGGGAGNVGNGEALRLKLNTPLAVSVALMDSCLRSLQVDLTNAQAEVRSPPPAGSRVSSGLVYVIYNRCASRLNVMN